MGEVNFSLEHISNAVYSHELGTTVGRNGNLEENCRPLISPCSDLKLWNFFGGCLEQNTHIVFVLVLVSLVLPRAWPMVTFPCPSSGQGQCTHFLIFNGLKIHSK